jgi:CelD/BcsL family acetyltransferase involved in cellulose biosynthesis
MIPVNMNSPVNDPSQPPPGLSVEVLTTAPELEQIRDAYEALLARSESPSPHLTLEWLLPWYRIYCQDYDLHFVIVRGPEGSLVGAAPLMTGRERWKLLSRTVVRFLGTGQGLLGQFFACPTDPAYQEQALRCIAECLVGLLAEHDVALLEHVSPFADGTRLITSLLQVSEVDLLLTTREPSVYGDLPGSFAEFISTVQSKNRRNYLRRGERLLSGPDQQLTGEDCASEEELDAFLEVLMRFSMERQATKGRTSTWTSTRNQLARREIFGAFLRRGWLRLEKLSCEGQPIAARLGFAYRDTYFANQSGFDQAFATLRPSHCLYGRRIHLCIEEGLRHFCFGPGDSQYKRDYFPEALPDTNIAVLRKRGAGRAKEAAKLFVQSLSSARAR